jgi:hypothetical protein
MPSPRGPISAPTRPTLIQSARPRMGASGLRGASAICPGSGGSTPRASAGRPLVTRLIQRICSAVSGGTAAASKKLPRNTAMHSPALELSRKKIDFWMLR